MAKKSEEEAEVFPFPKHIPLFARFPHLLHGQVEEAHEVLGRRLVGCQVLAGMLVESADLESQVPPHLALRRLQVAHQELEESGLAHAVGPYGGGGEERN